MARSADNIFDQAFILPVELAPRSALDQAESDDGPLRVADRASHDVLPSRNFGEIIAECRVAAFVMAAKTE